MIWLDDVQYTKGGFTNRNRMPDGSWLTVPIVRATAGGPIRNVQIDYGRDWMLKHARTLRAHYGAAAERLAAQIDCEYGHLASLNLGLLRLLLGIGAPHWFLQSGLGGKHRDTAVPISERLASMVEEVGGTVYLSGPSGRRYLDEAPFARRRIEVRYHDHQGPNPCSAGLLAA